MLKRVVPELNLLAHQTTLHMVKKPLHSARRDTFCWSSNNGTILCRGNFFVIIIIIVVVVVVVVVIWQLNTASITPLALTTTLTTLTPSFANCLEILGASNSSNPKGL